MEQSSVMRVALRSLWLAPPVGRQTDLGEIL